MLLSNNVCVQIDVQNLFYGGLNYEDAGRKIDYAKLQAFIEQQVTLDCRMAICSKAGMEYAASYFTPSFYYSAYVVKTPRYNGIRLFALLSKLGYKLRFRQYPEGLDPVANWKGSVGAMMQMDYLEWCPGYTVMVVASGNGVFAPVFEASKNNWPKVRRILCTWEHTMHSAYEDRDDIIDDVIYLNDLVLR